MLFPCFCFDIPYRQEANTIIKKIISGEYDKAFVECDSLINKNSKEPIFYLLKLTAIGVHDLDLDVISDSLNFFSVYKDADACIYNYEKKYGVSSYSCTVKGFIRTITAAYFILDKKYFSGLDIGLSAISYLQQAKQLDNSNIDVDLFLGFYSYARAELKKNFWWAFFLYIGDKRDGINKLKACSTNSQICKDAAKLILAEIYYRENNYEESEKITNSLLAEMPNSRLVLWTCAKRAEQQQLYDVAASYYKTLASSYEKINHGIKNSLVTRNKTAYMYFYAKDYFNAKEECKKILALSTKDNNNFKKQIIKSTNDLLLKIPKEQ